MRTLHLDGLFTDLLKLRDINVCRQSARNKIKTGMTKSNLLNRNYTFLLQEVTITIDHCKHADIVENDGKIVEKRENCEVAIKTTRDYE